MENWKSGGIRSTAAVFPPIIVIDKLVFAQELLVGKVWSPDF